jgi:sugar phosphate isomerase/epimerase
MQANMDRILSISTTTFDGYDLAVAVDEISRLGASHAELAFIQGYTDPFGEEIFNPENADRIQRLLSETGLSCFAFSAHMNLVTKGSAETFRRRMEFARRVGAKVIVTNAGLQQEKKAFIKTMETLSREAESLNLIIGLENPGDGKENIINSGKDGAKVVREIDSEWVKLNYDFGNVISHFFERLRPEEDFIYALPFSAHLHIKDVKSNGQGWSFVEIGKGSIDYSFILKTLASKYPQIPISLEIPLRITRDRDASPRRAASPLPLGEIRNVLKGSLNYVKGIIENRDGTNCDA